MFRKLLLARIPRYVWGVSLLVALVFPPMAQPQAATVLFDGSGVTGIDGLVVDSQTYGITIVEGSYDIEFPLDEVFSDASLINNAMIAALNDEETFMFLSLTAR